MNEKPLRSTTDSWLLCAGITTLPGVEKEKPRRDRFVGRCSPVPEPHRLSIYQEIETLLITNNKMSNPEVYDALADLAIITCQKSGQLISLGTVAKYTSDVKEKLGIIKRSSDIAQKFSDYTKEGLGRSTIMRELSLSVYGYEQLLKNYKAKN